MSISVDWLVRRFDHWIDRLVIPDDRYVCSVCDDRFLTSARGVEHIVRCHPEYEGVMVFEDTQQHSAAAAA